MEKCDIYDRSREHLTEGASFRDKVIRIETEVANMKLDIIENKGAVKFWGSMIVLCQVLGFAALYLK